MRQGIVAQRAEALLGRAVVATTPVAGGDSCVSTRIRLSDGTSALMKTRAGAPAGYFRSEAAGLSWLERAGGAPVPAILAVEDDCLLLAYVEPGRPSEAAAAELGRALARTHGAGADAFGEAPVGDAFIGSLPMRNRAVATWPEFFATQRILPYLRLGVDRGGVQPDDASAVERVVARLPDLAGPSEPPARLHGDLWSGNVLWGRDGIARLIDPAAYGGHRETDLAMLALFGAPHLSTILAAYQEVAPLAEGWEGRVGLHQLFPLLTHAVSHGGGYGARAGAIARDLLA